MQLISTFAVVIVLVALLCLDDSTCWHRHRNNRHRHHHNHHRHRHHHHHRHRHHHHYHDRDDRYHGGRDWDRELGDVRVDFKGGRQKIRNVVNFWNEKQSWSCVKGNRQHHRRPWTKREFNDTFINLIHRQSQMKSILFITHYLCKDIHRSKLEPVANNDGVYGKCVARPENKLSRYSKKDFDPKNLYKLYDACGDYISNIAEDYFQFLFIVKLVNRDFYNLFIKRAEMMCGSLYRCVAIEMQKNIEELDEDRSKGNIQVHIQLLHGGSGDENDIRPGTEFHTHARFHTLHDANIESYWFEQKHTQYIH